MTKIIGLDVGDKRVGVALTNDLGVNPKAYAYYERSRNRALDQIIDIINKNNIKILVSGVPLSESDEETEQSEKIRKFIRRISRRVKVDIIFIDEYLSTFEAKERVLSSKFKKYNRGDIDAESAAIILENYLSQVKPNG